MLKLFNESAHGVSDLAKSSQAALGNRVKNTQRDNRPKARFASHNRINYCAKDRKSSDYGNCYSRLGLMLSKIESSFRFPVRQPPSPFNHILDKAGRVLLQSF